MCLPPHNYTTVIPKYVPPITRADSISRKRHFTSWRFWEKAGENDDLNTPTIDEDYDRGKKGVDREFTRYANRGARIHASSQCKNPLQRECHYNDSDKFTGSEGND
ncbi:hypothetical protein NPIL_53491 [Nephila pilipes]|uniref:Uncharacterized protein n=1 Tax=Nephila pilipes TaxID=299642 RepID=A0A8X6PAG1_NEPPI|nr:hypothetical protein NPIL_53491 [Nephila pilipes]